MNSAILLVARILLAIIFILAGFGKLTDISGTAAYFGMYNLPAPSRRLAVVVWPRRTARRPGDPGRVPDPHRGLGARRLLHRHRARSRTGTGPTSDPDDPFPEESGDGRRLPGARPSRRRRAFGRRPAAASRLTPERTDTFDGKARTVRSGPFSWLPRRCNQARMCRQLSSVTGMAAGILLASRPHPACGNVHLERLFGAHRHRGDRRLFRRARPWACVPAGLGRRDFRDCRRAPSWWPVSRPAPRPSLLAVFTRGGKLPRPLRPGWRRCHGCFHAQPGAAEGPRRRRRHDRCLPIHAAPGRLSVDAMAGGVRAAQAVFATTSPSSSIIASRIRNFCGLPVTVIGSSVRMRT